ncbi:MAG: hypothetical protein L6Q54_12475 [Leptospiraceae bacterium]|nr:DUF4160 domain-containing protein [Leptospiraceae bacterium]MCK6382048.1 hypothetical protein [Leptospiraceae bacterium]NUM42956.1 DUF4160 domain-containing protein [Leptospiraceae bacterium]
MPKFAEFRNFEFYYFVKDAIADEPLHVHVAVSKDRYRFGKFWLEPDVSMDRKGALSTPDILKVEKALKKNLTKIKAQIEKIKKGESVKVIKL